MIQTIQRANQRWINRFDSGHHAFPHRVYIYKLNKYHYFHYIYQQHCILIRKKKKIAIRFNRKFSFHFPSFLSRLTLSINCAFCHNNRRTVVRLCWVQNLKTPKNCIFYRKVQRSTICTHFQGSVEWKFFSLKNKQKIENKNFIENVCLCSRVFC